MPVQATKILDGISKIGLKITGNKKRWPFKNEQNY